MRDTPSDVAVTGRQYRAAASAAWSGLSRLVAIAVHSNLLPFVRAHLDRLIPPFRLRYSRFSNRREVAKDLDT